MPVRRAFLFSSVGRPRAAAVLHRLCLLSAALALATASVAKADETVATCGGSPNHVFSASSAYGMATSDKCPQGALTLTASGGPYSAGQGAIWQASAPPGLEIVGATIPPGTLNVNYVNGGSTTQYGGDFYWSGGRSNIYADEPEASFGPFASRVFGFLLVCGRSTCTGSAPVASIAVSRITLAVAETTPPAVSAPTGLWSASGWVRGKWHVIVSGDSPSGMCGLVADVNAEALPESTSGADPSMWHQCSAAPLDDEVVTQGYADGPVPLHIGGWDAAGETVDHVKTIWVDNSQPTVGISGPTDAPATSTQYVTATAAAGPSGVAGISCSVDGAPGQWYPASTAQVPVSGVGPHRVQCYSENNAVDENGVHGTSTPQTFGIKLGLPTVSAVAFSKLVDRLACHRALVSVRSRGRWIAVHRRGKRVRVRTKERIRRVMVTRCHIRSVRRRVTVWVTVRRHGGWVRVRRRRTIRVLLRPHVVNAARRRVPHGRAATVDGWLGTTTGQALGGQTVEVLSAPDNGRDNFRIATTAVTDANGAWSARLRAGPSRLVEAYYGGSSTTEASGSAPARLVVPARVELLRVSPRRVAWGGTVRLTGRLLGGYLPPGGALVRLRIGFGSAFTTYGVREHVSGSGRFVTTYTFGAGDPATYRSFWFQMASLPMGDYPYAPADSRRVSVTVGGHPPSPRHR